MFCKSGLIVWIVTLLAHFAIVWFHKISMPLLATQGDFYKIPYSWGKVHTFFFSLWESTPPPRNSQSLPVGRMESFMIAFGTEVAFNFSLSGGFTIKSHVQCRIKLWNHEYFMGHTTSLFSHVTRIIYLINVEQQQQKIFVLWEYPVWPSYEKNFRFLPVTKNLIWYVLYTWNLTSRGTETITRSLPLGVFRSWRRSAITQTLSILETGMNALTDSISNEGRETWIGNPK